MEYRRIDGKTPGPVRMNYVHEFNQDKSVSVCLISTKAGGLGLNMTGANIVIIFDPNWNPAHDQQAQDRAYRIGQQRDVKVYRLISSGTIEENMYLRQIYKQQIASTLVSSESSKRYFNAVAGDKSQPGELYGPENVFRFGRGGCLTEDLIAREKTFEQGIMMAPYTSPESHVDEEVENYEENEQEEKNDDCVNSEDDWIRSQISYHSDDSDEVDRHDAGILRTQHMEIKTDEDESDEMMSLDTSNSLDEDAKLNLKSEQMLRHSVRNERYKEALSRKGTLSSSKKGDAHQEENKMKRKVKRNVQFLDVSSEDEEDGIARNVRRKKKKTKAKNNYSSDAEDSMEVILKECGANYIHSNMAVVGGSRVEHHVSKCAIKDVYELEQYSQMPANCHIQTLSQPNSEESDDLGVSCKSSITQSLITEDNTTQSDDPCCLYNPVVLHSKRESRITGNVTLLIGETPKTITRQHFADIAKSLSYKSTLEFAETVLSIDSKERLEILEDYYSKKYAHLQVVDTKGLYTVKVAEEKPKNKQIRVKNVKKNAALRKRPQNTRMRKRRPLAVNFDSDESEEENYRRDKRCMYKNRRKVVYRSDSDEERNDIERKDESSNDGDLEEENVSLKEGALSRRKAGVFQHESGAQNIHDELLCMDSETDGTISVEDSPQPPQVTTIERESSSSISLCKKANMDFLDDIFMCDNNLSDDHSDVNVTQVNRHDDKVTEVTSCSYGDEDSYFVLNKNYRKVIEDL
ncbi:DNA excision repair protein ERCC-6-like 2 [Saccoglossus kowalevskii]